MQEVISQLKYDIQNIEQKLKAIKNAKKQMQNLKGTPAYLTRQEAILLWENDIKEHKQMIDTYYIKLNELF